MHLLYILDCYTIQCGLLLAGRCIQFLERILKGQQQSLLTVSNNIHRRIQRLDSSLFYTWKDIALLCSICKTWGLIYILRENELKQTEMLNIPLRSDVVYIYIILRGFSLFFFFLNVWSWNSSVDQVETGQENVKVIQLVGDTKVIPLGILFFKLFVKFNKKWMKVSTNTLTPVS